MLTKKAHKEGIFYFIWRNIHISKNEHIYKFGVTECVDDPFIRLDRYEKDSELIKYFRIRNLYENEGKIIQLCKNKYKPSYYNGNEYFEGNLHSIMNEILSIIQDDILEEYNIDKDIMNEKFRKLNIYYDAMINSKYLYFLINHYQLKNVTNNCNFRKRYIRYLLTDYCNIIRPKENVILRNEVENDKVENNIEECNQIEIKSNDAEVRSDEEDVNNDVEIKNNDVEVKSNDVEIENDDVEVKSNDIEVESNGIEQTIYICHHCVKYYTTGQSDILRHFKRKKKCLSNDLSLHNYETSIIFSKNKYIIKINPDLLTLEFKLYLINNYNNRINIIDQTLYKKFIISNSDNTLNNTLNNNSNENSNNELLLANNSENNKKITVNGITFTSINIKSHVSKILYNNIYYNDEIKRYYCNECKFDYSHMNAVRSHIMNGNCSERVFNLQIIEKNKKKLI